MNVKKRKQITMLYRILIFIVCINLLNPLAVNSAFNQDIKTPILIKLVDEPEVIINKNGVFVSFTLRNVSEKPYSLTNGVLKVENVTVDKSVPVEELAMPTNMGAYLDEKDGLCIFDKLKIFNSEKYAELDFGVHLVSFEYKIENVVYTKYLSFFRKLRDDQLDTYEITKHNYGGLPVYTLKGGMSAEYAIEKSLAALNAGVSHTWDVREKPDGTLDLANGGPVSVYSSQHFLKKSIKKTVDLYNDELGKGTVHETVIISTGVPSAPYLSYFLGAPILPFHFLVSVNSFAEVKSMVYSGIRDGYNCYATAGYDPSIENEGVAWIKMLEMPIEYLTFLRQHKVKNIILMGADESGFGETQAKRIKTVVSKHVPSIYSQGDVFVMTHGGEVGLSNLKKNFKDYNLQTFEPQRSITDWESGITKSQLRDFKNSIKKMDSGIDVYAIEGSESIGFYNITVDFMLAFMKKNRETYGSSPINKIVMNEYLIGYPAYESMNGQIPMLYWQVLENDQNTAARFSSILKYKITKAYNGINFNALPVFFNAKSDRTPFINAIKGLGISNVTQNSWQKADVWDLTDGIESPCEVIALHIKNNIGVDNYKNYVSNLKKLTINDLKNMSKKEQFVELSHPDPTLTTDLASIPDAGLNIKKYNYPAQEYWNSREQLKEMSFHDYNSFNPKFIGWLDGASKTGNERRQQIIISQFDLGNTKDDYELKIGYKFNPKKEDGFKSYDASKGTEQNMDCFEYTRVPKTDWLDIPSRVMAREGAVWIVNGSVYDWDYNGLPGVVPFIKKNGVIKAQPQILSYKGEGAFGWNWGSKKTVSLFSRNKNINSSKLHLAMEEVFHRESASYKNVLGGMTFMNEGKPYNIKDLQPTWMLNYPHFNSKYLGPSGTSIRCFLSNPDPESCVGALERAWGSVEYAPTYEGWNDCSKLEYPEYIKRFSTLAYRQYDNLFERVPNARTYVAIKGNKLDIGIIDGDLGSFSDARGVNYSKTFGMRNSEVSNYYLYKKYDKLINLDGGSSSQIWYNARGPLHDWTGYPLVADNQGPFYSRLVSSFLMLVPKKNIDEITTYSSSNNQYMLLDNSDISFDYNDEIDHSSDKSFISISPSQSKLKDATGLIAGNFMVENSKTALGAILYYQGEDTYYEDTEGMRKVVPIMRNIFIVGVGKIPNYIVESIKNKPVVHGMGNDKELQNLLSDNNQGFYVIKMKNGSITHYRFDDNSNYSKYLNSKWHSFVIYHGKNSASGHWDFSVKVDDKEILGKGVPNKLSIPIFGSMFDMDVTTHAAIGMANIDGRFVTGNAKLAVDNYLLISGDTELGTIFNDINNISTGLTSDKQLPNLTNKYYHSGVFALQFEENKGMHSFALAGNQRQERFYALNLNTTRIKTKLDNPISYNVNPGDYYITNGENQCIKKTGDKNLGWVSYKDKEDNINWSLCDRYIVTNEQDNNAVSTRFLRTIKMYGESLYLNIGSSFSTTQIGDKKLKIPNYKLIVTKTKMKLTPIKIEDSKSSDKNPFLALSNNEKTSFSYQFVNVNSNTDNTDKDKITHSVNTTSILAGTLATGAILVGGASAYGAYKFFKGKFGVNNNVGEDFEMESIQTEEEPLMRGESSLRRRVRGLNMCD